jgi:hypothetical protein
VASDLNDEAAAERAEVIADVTETTHVILLTALVAIVVGFIITLIVLGSISRLWQKWSTPWAPHGG